MIKETKQRKILSPKLDIVFQALFGEQGSERITANLLQAILDEEITEIDLSKNPILRRDMPNDKLGVLDIIAKINNKENCDIELQIVEQQDIIERILFYWSKLYTRGIKKSEEYEVLEKTIVILISDKKIESLKELEEYHTEWKIIETKNRKKILTDKFEIHIIEIEKVNESKKEYNDKLLDWLYFLKNPESERVKEKMEENGAIKEAKEKLDKISEDEKMQQLAWWREKAIYEENTANKRAKRDGMREGIKLEKLETAKKMKNENLPIELIIKITELTKEEIERL